jgi:hypothetical protein
MYSPIVEPVDKSKDRTANDPTIRNQSQFLYLRAITRGRAWRLLNRLRRVDSQLLDLGCTAEEKEVKSRYYGGLETVTIDEIKGSEGRTEDFDRAFFPLHERNRQRWVNIARQRLGGAGLPPVELVHMEDAYFVRDGHHRISVARALGEKFIDAEVIHWDQHKPSEAKRISVYTPKTRLAGQQM